MVSSDALWHLQKREKIINKHPEILNLCGPFYPSFIVIIILVGIQWLFWINMKNDVSFLWIGFLAWINANTFYYSLSIFTHENTHGLVFGWKYRLLIAIIMEMGMLTFGGTWEYINIHYSLHHPHLNDKNKDPDCPGLADTLIRNKLKQYDSTLAKIIIPLVELLPCGVFFIRAFPFPFQKNDRSFKIVHKRGKQEQILVSISLITYGILIYYRMWNSILFAMWSVSFFLGRWCISLNGQAIAEHYSSNADKNTSPSKSTYNRLENLLNFNTGYHDEHHTFPNVSWFYLPKIRQISPDDFQNENHYSYFTLWFNWVWNGFNTEHYRTCKD